MATYFVIAGAQVIDGDGNIGTIALLAEEVDADEIVKSTKDAIDISKEIAMEAGYTVLSVGQMGSGSNSQGSGSGSRSDFFETESGYSQPYRKVIPIEAVVRSTQVNTNRDDDGNDVITTCPKITFYEPFVQHRNGTYGQMGSFSVWLNNDEDVDRFNAWLSQANLTLDDLPDMGEDVSPPQRKKLRKHPNEVILERDLTVIMYQRPFEKDDGSEGVTRSLHFDRENEVPGYVEGFWDEWVEEIPDDANRFEVEFGPDKCYGYPLRGERIRRD